MSERFQNRAERRAFTKKIRLERFSDADFSAWSFGGAVKGIALVTTFRNALEAEFFDPRDHLPEPHIGKLPRDGGRDERIDLSPVPSRRRG